MIMNFELQKKLIEEELKRRGQEPDLTDLNALIDTTLTYPENLKLILEYLNENRVKQGRKEGAKAELEKLLPKLTGATDYEIVKKRLKELEKGTK